MTEHSTPPPKPVRRQYVRFAFFQVAQEWKRLHAAEREADTREFIATIERFGGRMLLRSYTLVGTRADADFLLWQVTEDLPIFREFATQLNGTRLGQYLHPAYAYLSLTRRSIYEIHDAHGPDESDRITIAPGPSRYLFVYPFVKTRPWYALAKDERQGMMDEHIRVGRKYPQVKINTTYSYGLDDQEFVVAFETDDPAAFLDLVAELRETEASLYTLRDTPMFTCEALGLREMIAAVGGAQATTARPSSAADSAPVAAPALQALQQPHGASASRDDLAAFATEGNAVGAPSAWVAAGHVSDLTPGTSKLVYVGGEAVALWNLDGVVYATNNRCTHARGSLCDGLVAGTVVTCPWHGGQFDIPTGAAVSGPARIPIATYGIRINKGTIEVNLNESASEPVSQADSPLDAPVAHEDLDAVDKKLLNVLQWDFPLVERPFNQIAATLNAEFAETTAPLTEEAVMTRVEALRQRTIIRQLSAIFDTRKLGYQSSLVAMRLAPEHLDEAALIINEHPGVSHNYQRDNHFNLWFTLAVPPDEDLDAVLAALAARVGAEVTRKLPNLKMYKIAVKLDMEQDERAVTRKDDAPHYAKNPRAITARDRDLIRAVQDDLPTQARFFEAAAAQAGVTVPELFAWMAEMQRLGYLRRFAAILRHQEAGFTANGMITWKIPEERVDEVGYIAASYPQVSHCYRRPIYEDWPYNLFSMVHARSREACEEIAQRIAAEIGLSDYIILYSTHEYKKTRVEYFAHDWDDWGVGGAAWTRLDARIAAGEFRSGPRTWRERQVTAAGR
ncbi:MAG: chlorite dismutase family protein [Ktedonobacterales bacterium]|nr:chlorite dismutase family protein [Ktedonobacterales bacterium]